MRYYNFLTIFLMVIFVVSIGYSHGDDDKKKQKVTSQTMNSENDNTMMEDQHNENEDEHGEDVSHMDLHMNKDFATIRKDVEDSATMVTLKAVSLAFAIIGLAIVYLPRRKKKEEHNA